jgi:hypothetical protein
LIKIINFNKYKKFDVTVMQRITGFGFCDVVFFAYFRGLQEDGVSVATATSVAYHQRSMAQTNLI